MHLLLSQWLGEEVRGEMETQSSAQQNFPYLDGSVIILKYVFSKA